MSIQQVGSTKVYVVDAQVPVAKTSRGEGYGFFVTNLRWELWKEVQKNTAVSTGFEEKAYLSAQKSIQDMMKQNRELTAKLQSGEISATDAANKVKTQQETDLRGREIAAQSGSRPTTTVSTSTGVSTGVPTASRVESQKSIDKALTPEDEQQAQGTQQEVPKSEGFNTYVNKLLAGSNKDMGPGGGVKDMAKYRNRQTEHLLQVGREFGLNEQDVLNQIEKSGGGLYVQDYGKFNVPPVGDGTGTSTVVSSRQTKSVTSKAPMGPVDTSVEAPEIASRAAELKRLQDEYDALEAKSLRLTAPNTDLLQRTRASFASNIGEGGFGIDRRPRRELPMFDEERAATDVKSILDFFIESEVAKVGKGEGKEPAQTVDQARTLGIQKGLSFLKGQGATATQEGAFLLKDKYVPQEQPAFDAPLPKTGPIVAEPYVKGEAMPMLEESYGVPKGPAAVAPKFNELDYIMGTDRPAATLPAVSQDPLISKEAWQRFGAMGSDATTPADLTPTPSLSYPTSPIDGPILPLRSAQPTVSGQAPMPVQSPVATPMQAPTPTGVPTKITVGTDAKEIMDLKRETKENLEGSEDSKLLLESHSKKAPTTQERRNTYQVQVVMNAQKLASQPKKLERLAKVSSPIEKRPEYIVLVDRLYDTNKAAGTNPVAPSYSEINRVYAKDADTRKKAHEYLLAKSMLEDTIQKPV